MTRGVEVCESVSETGTPSSFSCPSPQPIVKLLNDSCSRIRAPSSDARGSRGIIQLSAVPWFELTSDEDQVLRWGGNVEVDGFLRD